MEQNNDIFAADEFIGDREKVKEEGAQAAGKKGVFIKILGWAPAVVSGIALFVLSSLGTLISFDFDFKKIVWATFILATGLRILTVSLGKKVAGNLRVQIGQTSEELKKARDEYNKEFDGVNPYIFRKWINAKNEEIKVSVYKSKMCRKAFKWHKRKARAEQRVIKLKTKRRVEWLEKCDTKIAEISEVVNDKEISKKLEWKRIRFHRIDYRNFVSAQNDDIMGREKYTINVEAEINKGVAKGIPSSVLIALFGALITATPLVGTLNPMAVVYDIIMTSINFSMGWFFVGEKVLRRQVTVIQSKRELLLEFKASQNNI